MVFLVQIVNQEQNLILIQFNVLIVLLVGLELGGSCNTQCLDGQEPNSDLTQCVTCPSTHSGRDGVCTQCLDGQKPNSDSSECVACPAGTASASGICVNCGRGKWQNGTRQALCKKLSSK
jgi:hypothetical protein